jgi:hypothetical protein
VESLQSHMILTMSHWSNGLPVCFLPQGTQVQIPRGDLCETGILLLAMSRYNIVDYDMWSLIFTKCCFLGFLDVKGILARDFLLLFYFSSKAPIWSHDSYPKFVSNIKSNSPRYSNYSSFCVDSINAELIFCLLIHLLHTASMGREIPRQRSHRGVRLNVN